MPTLRDDDPSAAGPWWPGRTASTRRSPIANAPKNVTRRLRVVGKEEIRSYSTRQWKEFDPQNGLIERMDLREGETSSDPIPSGAFSSTSMCHDLPLLLKRAPLRPLRGSRAR